MKFAPDCSLEDFCSHLSVPTRADGDLPPIATIIADTLDFEVVVLEEINSGLRDRSMANKKRRYFSLLC